MVIIRALLNPGKEGKCINRCPTYKMSMYSRSLMSMSFFSSFLCKDALKYSFMQSNWILDFVSIAAKPFANFITFKICPGLYLTDIVGSTTVYKRSKPITAQSLLCLQLKETILNQDTACFQSRGSHFTNIINCTVSIPQYTVLQTSCFVNGTVIILVALILGITFLLY